MRVSLLERLKTKLQSSRFLKNDSGVTIIEFAMLGPLVGLGLLVTLETSLMLYTEYVIQSSVQEAARLVRTGRAQDKNWDAAEFKDAVCRIARHLINCEDNVTVYMRSATTFKQLQTEMPSYLSIAAGGFGQDGDGNNNPPPFECGGSRDVIGLVATYDWRIATPWVMGNFANVVDNRTRRIVGFAMFRNEPFPTGGTTCES